MKAIENYFSVVLFVMLYKVVLSFKSLWMKFSSVAIQMKAGDRYSFVMLFVFKYLEI